MKIKIIAITEKGKKAIMCHVRESLTMSWKRKQALKMLGYRQDIISEEPLTLECEYKGAVGALMNQPLRIKHFTDEVDSALKENGAERDIDYIYRD